MSGMGAYSRRSRSFPPSDYALSLALFASVTTWRFTLASLAALALLGIVRTIVIRIRQLRAVETIAYSRVWALSGEQAQKDDAEFLGRVHGC